jgi:hypothetical protein
MAQGRGGSPGSLAGARIPGAGVLAPADPRAAVEWGLQEWESMSVYRVPAQEWPGFCRRLAEMHCGVSVSVWLSGRGRAGPGAPAGDAIPADDGDWQMLADGVVLLDLRAAPLPGGHEVQVSVEAESGLRDTFVLPDAVHMLLEQPRESGPGELRIDASDRSLRVRFDEPVFPGIPDGLP